MKEEILNLNLFTALYVYFKFQDKVCLLIIEVLPSKQACYPNASSLIPFKYQ